MHSTPPHPTLSQSPHSCPDCRRLPQAHAPGFKDPPVGSASAADYTAALQLLADHGCLHLDMARAYGSPEPGHGEGDMGRALAALPPDVREKMIVSTKATPGAISYPVKTEGLDYQSVTTQLRTSVEQLGRTVDIFYLHSVPREDDPQCTLEETLRAVNDLHKEGLFKRFGVSNFPAYGVMMVYYKCK